MAPTYKNYGRRDIKGFTADWCPIEQSVQNCRGYEKPNPPAAVAGVRIGERPVTANPMIAWDVELIITQ